jgi:hypothetical protein
MIMNQCNNCRLKDTRACTYHGYPESTIPESCNYKIGNAAEESLCNLTGTFIDVWTEEHNNKIRKELLDKIYNQLKNHAHLMWQSPQSFGQKNVVKWSEIENIFINLRKNKRGKQK